LSYYSVKNNYIFVHIPKNAGTSIHRALRRADPTLKAFDEIDAKHRTERHPAYANHFPVYMIEKLCNQYARTIPVASMFKFMIVRNPWERMVSLYEHRKRKRHMTYEGKPRNSPEDIAVIESGFKNWLLNTEHPGDSTLTTTSQLEWGYSKYGEGIDFIIPLERLEKAWPELLQALGLPTSDLMVENSGKGESKDYREYYDDETQEHVAHFFKPEIEAGGYDF
jgi:hypothetical protein